MTGSEKLVEIADRAQAGGWSHTAVELLLLAKQVALMESELVGLRRENERLAKVETQPR